VKTVLLPSLFDFARIGGAETTDDILLIMAANYIFALWFLSSSSIFLFSSPNLNGRRVDAYHTSMHGVGLVRI